MARAPTVLVGDNPVQVERTPSLSGTGKKKGKAGDGAERLLSDDTVKDMHARVLTGKIWRAGEGMWKAKSRLAHGLQGHWTTYGTSERHPCSLPRHQVAFWDKGQNIY